jgi:antibiotic biosynthesis monooxygenase (ABM) superfamily enzyme
LQNWLDSSDRQELIAEVKPLLADGDQIEVSTAREFWFVPASEHQPPPRWKQACVTFLVIMPLSLIVPQLWQPIFKRIAWLGSYPVSDVVITLSIVLLVVYFFMPMMTRWLAAWLNPQQREE